MDILKEAQEVLKGAIIDIKHTHSIMNVERIPDIKAISLKYGLPAIGIMDGGETNDPGASVSLKTQVVIIAVYVQVLGDQQKCIEEVRAIIDNCIAELRKKEHYRTSQAFEGFSRAWCAKKSEIKQVFNSKDESPLLLKLARIEFKIQEVLTK